MSSKYFSRILLIAGVLGFMHTRVWARQNTSCDVANVQPSALRCAFNVRPIMLPGLTSGQIYVSGSDLAQASYATYLYPNQNAMPASHRAAGNAIAASLQPLDANGKVDLANGKILAIAEGMSNTRLEMDALLQQFIQNNPAINPQFQFVNLSQGGCALTCWAAKGAGAIDPQVQIALIKHSNNRGQFSSGAPKDFDPPFTTIASKRFPTHAQLTQGMLKQRILDLKIQYPNLKLLYITSRSYGGWKCSPADPEANCEPVAFEEGFSVKWLVESQVTGSDAALNYSGPNPQAPWIAWGPYLWDASWPQDWFIANSAHPCAIGQTAIAKLWYDFLILDSTSRPWFRDNAAPTIPSSLSARVMSTSQINLAWNPAADNSGRVKYKIFRGGVLLKMTASVSYADAGLNPSTLYCYAVSAVDSAGNESARSNQACVTTSTTGVAGEAPQPGQFKLLQNHPNPFGRLSVAPETDIDFQLPEAGEVEVIIYNLFGEKIQTLAKARYPTGNHRVRWDGKDWQGNVAANGIYFYQLRVAAPAKGGAGRFSRVMKMTLLR